MSVHGERKLATGAVGVSPSSRRPAHEAAHAFAHQAAVEGVDGRVGGGRKPTEHFKVPGVYMRTMEEKSSFRRQEEEARRNNTAHDTLHE